MHALACKSSLSESMEPKNQGLVILFRPSLEAMQGWQGRLQAAIDASGMSKRQVSLKAGLGEAYVSQLLSMRKEPSTANLAKVCEALNVSFSWIVLGFEMDAELEALAAAWSRMPRERQLALLTFLGIAPLKT